MHRVFCTTDQGFLETDERIGHVEDGQFQFSLEAQSASIFLPRII